jgi:hypothetical protein
VGGLFARAGADGEYDSADSLGIGFAVGTFGGPDRSVSAGVGMLKVSGEDSVTPLLMLGGTSTISNHVAFVGETWIRADGEFRASEQPIGVGLRFFGDRLSADVGVVLVGELLDEGFPLPWGSISYHFGNGRAKEAEARRAAEAARPRRR